MFNLPTHTTREGMELGTTGAKRLNSSTGTLTSPSSSDTMPLPTLPFDIVVEILSRLPVKFLMQFQCVCKSWNYLISDPKFAKKHLRHASQSLILTFSNPDFVVIANPLSSVFTQATTTTTTIQLEYPLNQSAVIAGSCHGILCICLSRLAFLWNPFIRKFMKLPSLDQEYRIPPGFSFGYDDLSGSYKVVAISCEPAFIDGIRFLKNQVKVHTLGTTSWRTIQDFPPNTLILNESGKFVSGAIHWLTHRKTHSSWVIVSLDLEKEFYTELPQPDYGGINVVSLNLGVLRDCFCIFSHTVTFSDVWLMKEYGNKDSWTKLFRLPHTRDLDSWPFVSALYVSQDDQVLFDIERVELVVYNSRDDTFKDSGIQNMDHWMDSEVYHESLISPCF